MIKLDFIIAYNNSKYVNKCIECINSLEIPEGVCTEIMGIEGNNSISEVYRTCQSESDADFKVYIRENVYIINNRFIEDVLSFFENSPGIDAAGIIGGYREDDFIVWKEGAVNIINDDRADCYVMGQGNERVDYLSGQLIVCRGIVKWKSNEATNFDIDFSESLSAAGITMAVFNQEKPWCIWEYGNSHCEREDVFDLEKGAFAYVAKEKPLVSIMIAVHNGADFVSDTIESLLMQTYSPLQIILVDDGSTDRSSDIIKEYALCDDRIIPVFFEKNRHICYAINEAYKFAGGKYIANMGHDDLCRPWKFEQQVAFMERFGNYSACFSLCHIINDYLEITDDRNALSYIFGQPNRSRLDWQRRLFDEGNCLCIPSALIRKEMIPQGPLFSYDVVQLQDYELWLRLITKGAFHILQDKITLYRNFEKEHTNLSVTEAGDDRKNLRIIEEQRRLITRYLLELDAESFVEMKGKEFVCRDSNSEMELLCEKAFILRKLKNRRFYDLVAEIMKTEEGVKLLDEKYNFSTVDFYEDELEYYC